MDAHEPEEMANSMMRNSPLPDAERSEEKLPEEEGEKLLEEGGGEKLPEEIVTGKLNMSFPRKYFPLFFLLFGFVIQFFLQIPKIRECCGKSRRSAAYICGPCGACEYFPGFIGKCPTTGEAEACSQPLDSK